MEMSVRSSEYDRFGPWVVEISDLDPPSPLFQPYLTREEEPLFCIKIPRKIDRRDANSGMNLYDFLVSLYREDLVILERVGDDVRSQSFLYRDIQLLRYGENLLKGYLHLAMPATAYDLPFNAVSKEIMRRLVALIRERYCGEGGSEADQEAVVADESLSFYFTNLLAAEATRHPRFRLLASQGDTEVGGHETDGLRKLLFGAIGKTLLESLHLSDGRELKIINRGQPYKYKWQTVYALETCYIPVGKIVSVSWEHDTRNDVVSNLILKSNGSQLRFALLSANPSIASYTRFLSAA